MGDGDAQVEVAGGDTGSGNKQLATSLMRLTSIMEMLTEEKQRKGSGSKLDAALDSAQAQGSESTALGVGKKSAAIRRALRNALNEHPEEIHLLVERLMFEDLNSQTLPPGCQPRGLNARAWVEFRSRIGAYKASAYSSWCIAGVLDALMANKDPLARARACLGLFQMDQAAVDRGSWTLAAVLSLEQGPPMTSLAQHVAPDVMQGDSPFSKLLDSRWAEATLGYLRDQEDYLSRRRNIGKAGPGKTNEDTENQNQESKRRAKAKAKAKASAAADKSQDA